MKKHTIILSVAAAGCLLFSGLTIAAPVQPEGRAAEKALGASSPLLGELVTTNMLLMRILEEVMKGNETYNAQKELNHCSDGKKRYSPGYIISAGKKSLRCDVVKGYPEWVSVDNA